MSITTVYKWTEEKIVALAEALEKYPALWDRRCDDYKKNVVKYNARKQLAAELELEVPILYAKLNSIFSQYSREIKKGKEAMSGSSVDDSRFVSKWFLLPHLKYMNKTTELKEPMNSDTSCDSMFIVAHEGASDADEEIVQIYDDEIDGNTYIQDEEDHESPLNIQHGIQSPSSTFSVSHRKPPISRKRPQSDDAISKAVLSLASSLKNDGDEWDALGVLVAKKMRNLKNPQLQMKAENAIHNILIEAKASAEGFSLLSAPNPKIIFMQRKSTTKQ